MTWESTSELTFTQMPAGRPFWRVRSLFSIRSRRNDRNESGEMTTFFRFEGLAYPVMKLKIWSTSSQISGSQVKIGEIRVDFGRHRVVVAGAQMGI
jgi:hypothetical protein